MPGREEYELSEVAHNAQFDLDLTSEPITVEDLDAINQALEAKLAEPIDWTKGKDLF